MKFRKRREAGWIYPASFISIGLCLTILGPALTYLRERTGASKGEIAVLFVTSSIGYLIGSLTSGRLYDHGFGHRAVAGGLLGIAAATLTLPHLSSVTSLAIAVAFIGFSAGFVDVGGNTLVVWHTRGSGSARLLNALHLFFGIGALLSPLLVYVSIELTSGLALVAGIIAGYSVLIAGLVLVHETPTHETSAQEAFDATVQIPRRILLIVSVFFFLYVGVEIGFSGWIKTYAEGIGLPERSATLLNTLFFVSFTFGRLLATLLAKRIRSGPMLFGSCLLTSVLLLVMVLGNGNTAVVWSMTALIGITVAPQFATMIAYTEEHVHLTGRSTSWFVSAAGLGGLALPFWIGHLLDESSGAMPVAVFAGAVAATGWLFVVRTTLINHRGVPAELVQEPVGVHG